MKPAMGPNLDGFEDPADLWEFWKQMHCGVRPIKKARELFPDRPKGYVRAARDLGHYAANKATAMTCRARGDIQAALVYEMICDRIYDGLPIWARW